LGDNERKEILQLVGFGISEQEADDAMKEMRDYMWKEIITDPKVPQHLHGRNEYSINTPWEEEGINERRAELIDSILNVRKGNPKSADAAIALLKDSEILYLRNQDLRHHLLRTAAYWEVSGTLSMAFLPDFMRIPIIAKYNNRLRQSLRTFIQSGVDTAVRKELQDALGIVTVTAVPVPNAVSIFLDRYSRSSMEEALDDLRKDFSKHNKAIVNWEKKMRTTNKNGYGEALKVMNEIKASLAALEPTDKIEMLLSVTPGVVADIVAAALSGGSLGGGTLVEPAKKGLNLIRRWRQRARISFFNTGKNEAAKIPNQPELLVKAFGRSLTPMQTERFMMLTDSLQRLTQPAI
jgi:hypothetical protein